MPTGGSKVGPTSPEQEGHGSPILCLGSPIRCPVDHLLAMSAKKTEEPLEFYGAIGHRKVRLLLDTGAGANFLSADVASELGPVYDFSPRQRAARVILPDGTEVESRASKPLPVRLRNYREDVAFNVIKLQEFEAILGQPWLRETRALMDISEGKVTLKPSNQSVVVLMARGLPGGSTPEPVLTPPVTPVPVAPLLVQDGRIPWAAPSVPCSSRRQSAEGRSAS